MSTSTPVKHVTEEEYLHNPEFEHCEYVNGLVVPLNVGNKSHSIIQVRCAFAFQAYVRSHPGFYCATELHCRLIVNGEPHYRLPDVAVVAGDDPSGAPYLHRSPDLVVEIRSPEDAIPSLLHKAEEYFANGARMVWIVLPEDNSVVVLVPNAATRTFGLGESIDVSAVLRGLSIEVDELFR